HRNRHVRFVPEADISRITRSPHRRGRVMTKEYLSDGATAWMAANWLVPEPWEGSRRTAARVTLGTVSLVLPQLSYSLAIKSLGVDLSSGFSMTYVYDFPSGSGAKFYINGDYVYPIGGGQPAYWIEGEYWYDHPPSGTPVFWAKDRYVYEYPPSSTPKY